MSPTYKQFYTPSHTQHFFARLGLVLEPVDEMQSLVEGCCFLTRAIPDEVFVYEQGHSEFVPIRSGMKNQSML